MAALLKHGADPLILDLEKVGQAPGCVLAAQFPYYILPRFSSHRMVCCSSLHNMDPLNF